MFSSLKRFVAFSILLISGIPILIISITSFNAISTSIEEEVKQKNFLLCESIAGEIEGFIERPISVLTQVKHFLDGNTNTDQANTILYLNKTLADHKIFNSIEILDHSGKVVFKEPYDENIYGIDYSEQDFFKNAYFSGNMYWSNTFISLEYGQPSLAVSMKINMGVLVGYLNLSTLDRIIKRIRLGKEGYTMVVDSSGIVIAHNTSRFVLERVNVKSLPIVQSGLEKSEGAYRYTHEGVEYLGSVSFVSPTGWIVVVIQPVKEAFASIENTIRFTLIEIFIVLILTVVVAVFSLKKAFQSIILLTEQTKKISKGDYQAELPPKSFSEINELVANFKQMAISVEKRENELRNLIETIPQGVFEVNSEGLITLVNPAMTRIFEDDSQHLLNSYAWEHWLEGKRKHLTPEITAGTKNGQADSGVFYEKAKTKKGRVIDIQIDWTYKKDESDKAIGMVCVVSDITAKKVAEKALLLAHDELEIKVEERTKELYRAMEEATYANSAKSEFLANISHELRNPMHHILSYSKYGVEKFGSVDSKKLLHYFNQIRKSAERLMALLNDLLDLSKMESGKMEYVFSDYCLKKIVQEAISELEPSAKDKGQNIIFAPPTIPTLVPCDQFKIGQVVRNLLSNAIRYTPENNSITIQFSQGRIIEVFNAKSALKVSVKDKGVGIPDNELAFVFEKFTQSTYTKTGAGGTGLGLAICGEIIQAHQGRIWAENNNDGGATFNFMLNYEKQVR